MRCGACGAWISYGKKEVSGREPRWRCPGFNACGQGCQSAHDLPAVTWYRCKVCKGETGVKK